MNNMKPVSTNVKDINRAVMILHVASEFQVLKLKVKNSTNSYNKYKYSMTKINCPYRMM